MPRLPFNLIDTEPGPGSRVRELPLPHLGGKLFALGAAIFAAERRLAAPFGILAWGRTLA